MKAIEIKRLRRKRRKRRVRKRVTGTADRPRLTVFRSHKNLYAQIIDDSVGRTLVSASSIEAPLRKDLPKGGGNRSAAGVLGTELATRAIKAGVGKVVFDRNGYPYHGRVGDFAAAARKGGLKF